MSTTATSTHTGLGRTLEDRLGQARAANLRTALTGQPFRRLSDHAERAIDVSRLCQMVHLDPDATGRRLVLGNGTNAYYVDDHSSALRAIESAAELGLRRFYLQAVPSIQRDPIGVLDAMATAVGTVQEQFGDHVQLVVDPQALCMRTDLRWGLSTSDGAIDAEQTLVLLGTAIERFAQLGVFGVMTIGRINGEVEVARAALRSVGKPTRLYSFSTNSETPTAYFERTGGDPRRAITGQKILVGNAIEMVLRTLGDLVEGIDGMLQKPIENVHVLGVLADLSQGRRTVSDYLALPDVQRFYDSHPDLTVSNPHLDPAQLTAAPVGRLALGGYEVSGTFSARGLLADRFGLAIAWAVAEETYLTALAASGGDLEMLVGRGMAWFVATGRELGLI